MGVKQTKPLLTDADIAELQNSTGFSSSQIIRLCNRFVKLSKGSEQLAAKNLLEMHEIVSNPLGERIVYAFFWSPNSPVDEEESAVEKTIDVKQFITQLACFRPVKPEKTKAKHEQNRMEEGVSSDVPNSRTAKLRFVFHMYDLDNDNGISRLELIKILSMMIGSNISDDQLTSIADRTMAEADKDLNDVIDFDEFQKIMDTVDIEQRMSIRFLS